MPPSSNLRQSDDFAWLYLLPAHRHIVCVGNPTPGLEAAAADLGAVVSVMDAQTQLPGSGPIDALVVVSRDAAETRAAVESCRTRLRSDGVVVQLIGSASVTGRADWATLGKQSRSAFRRRLSKLVGMVGARTASWLRSDVPTRSRHHASDVRFVRAPADLTPSRRLDAVSVSLGSLSVPAYVSDLAARFGLAFDEARWTFGPPRGFASQKVVYGLARSEGPIDTILKITQSSRFNARLDAEADALTALAAIPGLQFVVPKVVFRSEYAGRSVICQTMIAGSSLRTRATRNARDQVATAGFQAATDLSARTVSPPTPGESAAAINGLLDDFLNIYTPPSTTVTALTAVAGRLAEVDIPTVFMHGDFGVWNLLIDENDKVGVLDWENGDPQGAPLWDLFIYARTLGVFLADVSGVRYSPSVFARQLLGQSELRHALFDHIREYRRHVEVPVPSVDGLFVMCWVQQAVREAASLVSPTWLGSHGTQLLDQAIRKPLGFRG
jgi:hypothetical protein